jgi:hypothetical protein
VKKLKDMKLFFDLFMGRKTSRGGASR